MKKFIFSGLRARILLLVTLAFTPWLLSNIYQNMEARQHAIVEAQEEVRRLLSIIAFDQKETIIETRSFLQILSALPEINRGPLENCRRNLASAFKQTINYVNFGALDAHGKLLCDALETSDSIAFNDRDWFKQALKTRQFVVSSLITGKISNNPFL
jgi:hypothetical protein